jgi:META domain
VPPDADPAPVPASLTPATRETLLGTWLPADGSGRRAPHPPSITLTADSRYTGGDGCNGSQGRWGAGAAGLIIATSGLSTLIGCDDMVQVPSWLAGAARAAFDGPVLVLLDRTGHERSARGAGLPRPLDPLVQARADLLGGVGAALPFGVGRHRARRHDTRETGQSDHFPPAHALTYRAWPET